MAPQENDTIEGPDGDVTWTITANNAGSADPLPGGFTEIEQIIGGSGNDTFAFADGVNILGLIDGGRARTNSTTPLGPRR